VARSILCHEFFKPFFLLLTKKLMVIKISGILVFLLLASISISFGQVDPTPPPGAVPIDGGVGFLLAAGAAYGVKKIRERRNSSTKN
jgi:hypothetical protein